MHTAHDAGCEHTYTNIHNACTHGRASVSLARLLSPLGARSHCAELGVLEPHVHTALIRARAQQARPPRLPRRA